jgi:hypothetical protein
MVISYSLATDWHIMPIWQQKVHYEKPEPLHAFSALICVPLPLTHQGLKNGTQIKSDASHTLISADQA